VLSLLKDSWTRVQQELRARAGESSYANWLADLRPVLLERGVAYLEAKTRLCSDRVQRLFRPLLQEVLSAEIGVPVGVEIQAAPETARLDDLEVGPQNPIVDEGNRTAYLVLKDLVARVRAELGNQFFFHGEPGVGKTFLLRWWQSLLPERSMYFALPALLKAFQAVHYEREVQRLQLELLDARPLVLDEIHRIAGKPKLQAFVLDVLQRRQAMPVPTVLASRFPPRDIRELDPSLCSVFAAGFVARIDAPGPLGRLRYLRAIEGAPSRNGRAEVIESLAQRTSGSYPEIRAAWARSRQGGIPPKYLELIDPGRTFGRLRDRVAERLGLPQEQLLGPSQSRLLSQARKILAFLCVQEGLSRAEVGRYMAGRSRAAVSYMTRSLEREMASSPHVRAQVEGIL
jgi:chromosomal replication initiation ATPase DnaA